MKAVLAAYKASPTEETRNAVIEAYYPTIEKLEKRIVAKLKLKTEEGEFISDMVLSLIEALPHWEESRGGWDAFAYRVMRNRIVSVLRASGKEKVKHQAVTKKLYEMQVETEYKLGHKANDADIASTLGVTEDSVDKLRKSINRWQQLVQEIATTQDVPFQLPDKLLDVLTPQEILIMQLLFERGFTTREAAETLKITQNQVFQYVRQARKKFIKKYGKRGLYSLIA